MAAYHQMGHDSWNLLDEKSLNGYKGIILSPVNDSPDEVAIRLNKLGNRKDALDIVLDPQFYKPTSDRGKLAEWKHFSKEVDTVDLSNMAWWNKRCESIISTAKYIGANSVCSPALLPRIYDDEYYSWTVKCAEKLHNSASNEGLETLLTAIIRLPELANKGVSQRIASILTSNNIARVYMVFFDDLSPRHQRTDFTALSGAMILIKLLENAGTKVLVSFSGLDAILWKAAGASDAATGKFFNLRKFVPGRWDDAAEGGRVVPYWTDSHLITWLREDDVRLLDSKGLINRASAISNPYSVEILKILDEGTGKPWQGVSWRQYLYWFMQIENTVNNKNSAAKKMLVEADYLWGQIHKPGEEIYLFDRLNTGDWIRPWLNAIQIFGSSN